MSGTRSQASIHKNMAACIWRYVCDIPATSSGTVTTYFIYRATTTYSWAIWCIKTVKMMGIDHNGRIAQWLTMMEGQQSLTLHWCSLSRWGRERFTSSFAYQGSQYSVDDYMQPVALQITEGIQPTIFDTLLTLIFIMRQEGYCNVCCI